MSKAYQTCSSFQIYYFNTFYMVQKSIINGALVAKILDMDRMYIVRKLLKRNTLLGLGVCFNLLRYILIGLSTLHRGLDATWDTHIHYQNIPDPVPLPIQASC